MIVLDTHVLLWFILDDRRLPAALKRQMEADPRDVYVPSVCLWESMILSEKGRLTLKHDPTGRHLQGLVTDCGFVEAPLTSEIAVLSRTLGFDHADPGDRFIAATAFAYGAKLATSDARLRQLEWLEFAY